jgi:hypothetical protein
VGREWLIGCRRRLGKIAAWNPQSADDRESEQEDQNEADTTRHEILPLGQVWPSFHCSSMPLGFFYSFVIRVSNRWELGNSEKKEDASLIQVR